jgi:hypothetical protein
MGILVHRARLLHHVLKVLVEEGRLELAELLHPTKGFGAKRVEKFLPRDHKKFELRNRLEAPTGAGLLEEIV